MNTAPSPPPTLPTKQNVTQKPDFDEPAISPATKRPSRPSAACGQPAPDGGCCPRSACPHTAVKPKPNEDGLELQQKQSNKLVFDHLLFATGRSTCAKALQLQGAFTNYMGMGDYRLQTKQRQWGLFCITPWRCVPPLQERGQVLKARGLTQHAVNVRTAGRAV